MAAFLARNLGGPYTPEEAAERAAAVPALRIPDPEQGFSAVEREPGGLRSLAQIAIPVPAPPLPMPSDPDFHVEAAS